MLIICVSLSNYSSLLFIFVSKNGQYESLLNVGPLEGNIVKSASDKCVKKYKRDLGVLDFAGKRLCFFLSLISSYYINSLFLSPDKFTCTCRQL